MDSLTLEHMNGLLRSEMGATIVHGLRHQWQMEDATEEEVWIMAMKKGLVDINRVFSYEKLDLVSWDFEHILESTTIPEVDAIMRRCLEVDDTTHNRRKLNYAVKHGDIDSFHRLRNVQPDDFPSSSDRRSLFLDAIKFGHLKLAEWMYDNWSWSILDTSTCTSIHEKICMRAIISSDMFGWAKSVILPNRLNCSLVARAAEYGHIIAYDYLVRHSSNPDYAHHFLIAARWGQMNILRRILESNSFSVELYNKALLKAVNYGHMDTCRFILKLGATNYDAASGKACREGHGDIMSFIDSWKQR